VIFLLKYQRNPQETEHKKRKRERKRIEKKRKKKGGRKRKAPRVSSNKGGKSIFQEEKNTSTSKSTFRCDSIPPPLHHTISKTPSKIFEKVFLTLFGPSFSLAIYIT
jgi:hypothetical protein